jgi:hypothetical protein
MLDRTEAARAADKYIPSARGAVAPTDNQPPSMIDSAEEAMAELSAWLLDHPVIQLPLEAKDGGAFVERTRIALSDMEAERTVKVAPLNEQLAGINGEYREVRQPMERALKELRGRLTAYATAIEAARIAEAEQLRQEAEAKEQAARDAEAREREAIDDAAQGAEADVGGAIAQADAQFAAYQKAGRAAAVATRSVPVRIGSVMGGKSLSMRTVRKLVVSDAAMAIKSIGLTERITAAILADTRLYEEAYGELPAGITETHERSM